MSHRCRTYPALHLVRLISNYFPWVTANPDEHAWKGLYYLYWMYEQSLKLEANRSYSEVIVPLCSKVHVKNIICEDVSIAVFLERFRRMWPRQSAVQLSKTWGRYNDLIQVESEEDIARSKTRRLVDYIMDLFTVIDSFTKVLERLAMKPSDLWTRLKDTSDVRLLTKIIQCVRTLDVEAFIKDEDEDRLDKFAWTLCSTVIMVHCDRAITEHTNWSSPTSVQVALVRRYTVDTKNRIVIKTFRGVANGLRGPFVAQDDGTIPRIEPLSTEEWLSNHQPASVVEDLSGGIVYLRVDRPGTVIRMNEQGGIEPCAVDTEQERCFLQLGGPYARAYCLNNE